MARLVLIFCLASVFSVRPAGAAQTCAGSLIYRASFGQQENYVPTIPGPSFVIDDPVEFYRTMRRRADAQRRSAPESPLGFDVPEFGTTLRWMVNELQTPRAKTSADRFPENRVFFKAVRGEAAQFLHAGRIPYLAFLNFCVRFSAAMYAKDRPLEKSLLAQTEGVLKKLLETASEGFVIPTEMRLNKASFNHVRVVPLYFAGLATEAQPVHGRQLDPISYLYHDVRAHAYVMALGDGRISGDGEPVIFTDNDEARIAQRERYHLARRRKLATIHDAGFRIAVESVGFFYWHELGDATYEPGPIVRFHEKRRSKIHPWQPLAKRIEATLLPSELLLISLGGGSERVLPAAIEWDYELWRDLQLK